MANISNTRTLHREVYVFVFELSLAEEIKTELVASNYSVLVKRVVLSVKDLLIKIENLA